RIANTLTRSWVLEMSGIAQQGPASAGRLAEVAVPLAYYRQLSVLAARRYPVSESWMRLQELAVVGVAIGEELLRLAQVDRYRSHVDPTVGRPGEEGQLPNAREAELTAVFLDTFEITPGEQPL